jgi:fructokinase
MWAPSGKVCRALDRCKPCTNLTKSNLDLRGKRMRLYGGLEAGGSKCVCAVGTGPDHVRAVTRFATTTPAETVARVVAFFAPYRDAMTALGVASFGPLDARLASPFFGHITSTPKPGWAHTDLAGALHQALDLPVAFDTDVNAAALGEHRWGMAQGLDTFIYLTIGTGIGGGAMINGQLLHGLLHPEMGHIRIPHDWQTDPFPGQCPFHGDCLEGLAAGPALEARWGQPASTFPLDHPAWTLETHYLSLGLATFICTLAPQRIIMGGGVMQQTHLFPRLRREVQQLLNDYVQTPALRQHIDEYIVPPALGDQSGVLGAIALACRTPYMDDPDSM